MSNSNTKDDSDDDDAEITGAKMVPSSESFLYLLLNALDTASLPSYFWRSLASSLSSRVSEILNRGGVSARALKSQRETVRAEIRECVLRGSRMPKTVVLGDAQAAPKGEEPVDNWEMEAAVMEQSVVGLLGR